MKPWQLELGLYPGVLLGIRTYIQKEFTEHVLYIPFIEICLTIYENE